VILLKSLLALINQAHDHGIGEGTSCSDNVWILGEVTSKSCWFSPNDLDGPGGDLLIGHRVEISAVHV
jgi:hypothetical protein